MTDVLTEVLRAVRLEGTAYFQADFAAPWGMSFAGSDFANFHLVTAGSCWLSSADREQPIQLGAGHLAVFPHGGRHRLANELDSRTLPAPRLIEMTERSDDGRLVYGGDGERCTLICGHFEYDRNAPHPLWDALPESIVLQGDSGSIFETAAQMTIDASASSEPAVVDRLAEILLIQIIRAHARASEVRDGFVAALADEAVGRTIAAIHAEPERPWTVSTLADIARLSRSAFAGTFHRLVGKAPMQYVTVWRMHRARELLTGTTLSMAEIAERVGYESEFSFAKAFKRVFDVAPGSVRQKVG